MPNRTREILTATFNLEREAFRYTALNGDLGPTTRDLSRTGRILKAIDHAYENPERDHANDVTDANIAFKTAIA